MQSGKGEFHMDLKQVLFERTLIELEGFQYLERSRYSHTEEEIERQRERFLSAYQIIAEAELEDEYFAWRATRDPE